jgi:translation initiation factor eIF-2B subunit gamma
MFFESNPSTTSSARIPEFQAIILAGPGNGLYPLTNPISTFSFSNKDNNNNNILPNASLPKALLPVGNRPLIEFVLKWVEDGGILGRS